MVMIFHHIISFIFIICVILNLILAIHISNGIKKFFHSYWIEIGSPSNLDPKGQLVYLRLFFHKERLPDEIRKRYSHHINLLMVVRALGLLCFFLIIALAFAFPELFNHGHHVDLT